ncbi:MAG: hypothetical protein MJ192_01130 [Clostridia bacterium]|nr:hypothetical protein [Clostridia bacterium]
MTLNELIVKLCGMMTVSGNERHATRELEALIGPTFDEMKVDAVGNHLFLKKSSRKNAPKILIDCHLDEIGMMVSGYEDGGFLRVVNVGGVDTRILPAGEVVIYGKETLYGVVATSPTYLLPPDDTEKLKKITELLIDTGYSKEELQELAPLGTPVGFKPVYGKLMNGRIYGKAFDDKACGACAVWGIDAVPRSELAGDVYFLFSTFEETGMLGGRTGGFGVRPDYALCMDVTHAAIPDTPDLTLSPMGSGISITTGVICNRRLTRMSMDLCRNGKIPFIPEAATGSTGTNTNVLNNCAEGIPTTLWSLPIKSMHSAAEVLALEDAKALAAGVSAFIRSKEIAEVFGK